MTKEKGCSGGVLDNFTVCDGKKQASSADIETVVDSKAIQLTDQILIIRSTNTGTKVYKAFLNDLSPETALFILSKAAQAMPHTDPGDGFTLWNDDGFIRVAGNVEDQGRISAKALALALKELYKKLPTENPNDGNLWNNGGNITQGTNVKGNNNVSNK